MSDDRHKQLTVALGSGSVAIIIAGLVIALSGSWFGWLILLFGVLDLAAVPFLVRLIGGGRRGAGSGTPAAPPGSDKVPAAPPDPAHNPYARED